MVQDLGAGNTVRWIRQKAASNGDDMILAIEDVNERIHTIRYDGNTRAFSGFLTHTAFAYGNADQNRPFDVAWDFATGPNTVVLVYSDNSAIRFKVSGDGGVTWTIEQTVTGAVQAHWVQLERDPSNVVHLVIKDQLDEPARVEVDGRQLDRDHHAHPALDQHREQRHQPERRDVRARDVAPDWRAPPRR